MVTGGIVAQRMGQPACCSRSKSLQLSSSLTLCLAKNSGPQRNEVFSHAVALAPFSQNDSGREGCGLAQAQLTQAKAVDGFVLLEQQADAGRRDAFTQQDVGDG